MQINDSVLQNREKAALTLRQLYLSNGYTPYRMSKFEEYDLYAKNKEFLVSDNVITFNDTDGKLLALKPDVTLSIIKNNPDDPTLTKKVFYSENVYRVQKADGPFEEIMQTGAECFGFVDSTEVCNTITLAAKSLQLLSPDFVLALSDLDVISGLVNTLGISEDAAQKVYTAVGERNIREINTICKSCKNQNALKTLLELLKIHGEIGKVLPKLSKILKDTQNDFIPLLNDLSTLSLAQSIYVDFSVTGDLNYYNGVVFKGFIKNIPSQVLLGGRYDKLMRKMGKKSSAIGFAVYTDMLDRLDIDNAKYSENDGYINVALPKGRLGEKIYDMFARAGYDCPDILKSGRKLIFENKKAGVRYFWVKPSDVPIYVERGVADIGVAGKDILLEYAPDVYELLDLKKGKCRMAVAAPKDYKDDPTKTLIIATKFANTAKKHYRSLGREIDIIHLNGSIEIAPILGLSDVIVDIVETGTTLKENNLEVFNTLFDISARLISNKSAYKFKFDKIDAIEKALFNIAEETK